MPMILVYAVFLAFTMNGKLISGNSHWPSGSYGLPRPTSGCPEYWKEGYRYQDTENDHSSNQHSRSYHLSGKVSEHGIRQEFCVKEDSLFDEADLDWPDGQYCIYKYGEECPRGLKEGWIFWDDENQADIDGGNKVYGYTPEGVYELDTLIYFCCNTQGNASVPIELPLTDSFYLFPYKSEKCQKVKHTTVHSEFIHWDDEDQANRNAHSEYVPYGVVLDPWDTKILYCYYDTGVCGKKGAMCKNVSVAEPDMEGKSVIGDFPTAMMKKHRQVFPLSDEKKHTITEVLIGCAIAGAIVVSALTGIFIRILLVKRTAGIDEYEEDDFPLPDHIP